MVYPPKSWVGGVIDHGCKSQAEGPVSPVPVLAFRPYLEPASYRAGEFRCTVQETELPQACIASVAALFFSFWVCNRRILFTFCSCRD